MNFYLTCQIDCIPVAKGRPRFVKRGKFVTSYTPKKTRDYELMLGEFVKGCMGTREITDARLFVKLDFYLPIPKATPKKVKQELTSSILANHKKKPDIDNLVKSVLDALNGIAYVDDGQVATLQASKYYSNTPGIAITIEEF